MKHVRFKMDNMEIIVPVSDIILVKSGDMFMMKIADQGLKLTPEQYDVMRGFLDETDAPFEIDSSMEMK